jgi:hypothetical protein
MLHSVKHENGLKMIEMIQFDVVLTRCYCKTVIVDMPQISGHPIFTL